MRRFVVAAVLMVAFSTRASAATEFFIGQDPITKKCGITKVKPDGKTSIMIGTSSYKTKDEAKAARKTAAECPGSKAGQAN